MKLLTNSKANKIREKTVSSKENDLQQTKSICTGAEGGHPSYNGSLSLGLSNHCNNDRNSSDKFINFW